MVTDLKRISGSAFESVLLHVLMQGADGSHKPGKRSLKARGKLVLDSPFKEPKLHLTLRLYPPTNMACESKRSVGSWCLRRHMAIHAFRDP